MHGIDESGQPLSAKERARYKAYNSHKPRTNPRAKRTYKSVEFVDSSMDTDVLDTNPSGTPTKKTKTPSSLESTPEKKSSPTKVLSPPKIFDLNDDLNLSESSSEGEIISEAELTEAEPLKSPIIVKWAAPQTSPNKSLDRVKSASKTVTSVNTSPKPKSSSQTSPVMSPLKKKPKDSQASPIPHRHKHPICFTSKQKSKTSASADDPCIRKATRPAPVVSGPNKTAVPKATPKPQPKPAVLEETKSPLVMKPKAKVASKSATELSKSARQRSVTVPNPKVSTNTEDFFYQETSYTGLCATSNDS